MATISGTVDLVDTTSIVTTDIDPILQTSYIYTSTFYNSSNILNTIELADTTNTPKRRSAGDLGYGGTPVTGSIFGSAIILPNNRT